MTQRYLGGIITANPTEPSSNLSTASASGMWTLQEALSFYRAGDWPDPTNTPSVGLIKGGYAASAPTDTVNSTGGSTIDPTVNFSVIAKKFPGSATSTTNQSSETLSKAVAAINSTTIDQFTEQAHIRARGRSLAFKIESTTANVAWELGTPRVDFRLDGRRG